MDKDRFKSAMDEVKFSDGFERDTIDLMRRAVRQEVQKEDEKMNTRKFMRISVMITAIVVVLAATAFALTVFLTPKEVAAKAGNNELASAFDSKGAVNINKSVNTGDFTVTLHGIVSGKGLTSFDREAEADRSYIVASVAYTDGRKIEEVGETGMIFTPLVSGYKPWQVNAWTLKGGSNSFLYEGVNYFVFECEDLEIFSDHTVYLAAYEGQAPSAEIFSYSASGDITFKESFDKPHAMFTLPLDAKKASPDAAKKLLDSALVVIQ